jgi:CRP-like cAMP-binding protein
LSKEKSKKGITKFSAEHPADFRCLRKSPVFRGMESDEVNLFLSAITCEHIAYKRGAVIIKPGDILTSFGIVLEGSVTLNATKIHDHAKAIQLMNYRPSEVFALGTVTSTSDHKAIQPYLAQTASRILWIDRANLLQGDRCLPDTLYRKILNNLITANADGDMLFQIKVGILAYRGLGDRILEYMSAMSNWMGGVKTIDTGMNHEQFAAHLCVNRSSMTNMLSRMQAEGILTYKKTGETITITIL